MKSRDKSKLSGPLKSGGQAKHGGYTFLAKGTLPENRKYILRYLSAAREGLVRDIGLVEEQLSTAQIIIIDRVISKLGVIRCIEEHIKETGVIKGDDVAPSLKASYLAYSNSIRLDLERLGIHTKKADKVLDAQEYIKQFDDKEKKNKSK